MTPAERANALVEDPAFLDIAPHAAARLALEIADAIREAVLAEREACAMVADGYRVDLDDPRHRDEADAIAAAIRARTD